MTTGVLSAGEFDDILHRVDQKLRDAEEQTRRLIDRVRHAMSWLGPFGHGVMEVLEKIWEILQKIGSEIATFFTQPGVPWTLWNHGNDWSGPPVAGRIAKLVGEATLDETRADDRWQGSAADAYRNTLPRQKEALAKLVSVAQDIDDVLTKMAVAIGAFWIAVLSAIIALVVELTAETAAAATVVGAPPAAAAGGISLGKALGLIAGAASLLYGFVMSDTAPAIKDLRQSLYDATAFPGGRWPRSTTDMSDGSLSDGDGTDWHLKVS
jgi:hypothetical protein